MPAFTIKDLENLSGIKAHTIRIWEQRYSFLKPQRTTTNIRYYTNDELKTILNIALLSKYGYKISHIDKMSGDEIKEKILTLSHAQAQQERIINDLIQCMVDMNIEKFEDILDDYIEARGIEKTIPYIIFPFMERVGILWITNHINPAQEHLVSNIIRQKLIVGIESSTTPLDYNKTVLLFLPEGEHHEIGLLFMHFLLKNRGVKVLYIGANVPLKDVVYVAKLKKPDYNYSHLTSVAHNFNLEKFLNYMHTHLPETPLLVSGEPINNYKKKKPANVYFQHSITEVLNYISGLN